MPQPTVKGGEQLEVFAKLNDGGEVVGRHHGVVDIATNIRT